MSDRYNYLTVALEKNIRDDDAKVLISAIEMLRGVLKVKGNVSNGTEFTAEARIRKELGTKLWNILYPKED